MGGVRGGGRGRGRGRKREDEGRRTAKVRAEGEWKEGGGESSRRRGEEERCESPPFVMDKPWGWTIPVNMDRRSGLDHTCP